VLLLLALRAAAVRALLTDGKGRPNSMSRITSLVAFVAALCLATVATATADPIALTGGTIWAMGLTKAGPASFTGVPSFSFVGEVAPSEGRIDPFTYCLVCFPGSTISADANLSGSALPGVVTYKGNMYPVGFSVTEEAALALEFSAGTVTVPALTRFPTLVTVPFTVNGIFSTDLFGADPGKIAITGQGFASVLFRSRMITENSRAWFADQVRYDFSQSTPVPEPATLILVGSGLVVARSLSRTRLRRRS
jgi:hypothetical protein